MSVLYQQSATQVVAQLKSGDISIQDTLNALEARITSVDHKINALHSTEKSRRNH